MIKKTCQMKLLRSKSGRSSCTRHKHGCTRQARQIWLEPYRVLGIYGLNGSINTSLLSNSIFNSTKSHNGIQFGKANAAFFCTDISKCLRMQQLRIILSCCLDQTILRSPIKTRYRVRDGRTRQTKMVSYT